MRFVFTDHIKYQMFNRNISESQVTTTSKVLTGRKKTSVILL